MPITIDDLEAAGFTSEQILRVIAAERERRQRKVRAKWRTDKQRRRGVVSTDVHPETGGVSTKVHPAMRMSTNVRVDPPPHSSVSPPPSRLEPNGSNLSGPTIARRKVPLPDDWNPVVLEQDAAELARFKDYARANRKLYADWDAAWRNWKSSPYRKANGGRPNGHGRQLPEGNVSIADIHKIADEYRRREEASRADLFRTPDDAGSNRRRG